MAHLYQRGRVHWIAYYQAGKLVRKSLGRDKRLAEKVAKDIEGQLVRAEHGLTIPDLSVSDAVARFVGARQGRVSPKWAKVTEDRLRSFFEWAAVTRLKHVTPALCEEYFTHRTTSRGLSTATSDFEIIRTFFRWAERMGYLRQTPLKTVTPLPAAPKEPIRFLSRPEGERLLAACQKPVPLRGPGKKGPKRRTRPRQTPLYPMAMLAVYGGLRLGEITHLRWEDVDFEANGGLLHVRVSEEFTPKDKESRRIPLHPKLREALLAYQDTTGRNAGLVFQTGNGTRYSGDNLRRELQRVARQVKVAGVHWYTLRHTFASRLAMEGVSLHKIAKFLGHSTIRTTEQHYAGLVPEELHEDIAKL